MKKGSYSQIVYNPSNEYGANQRSPYLAATSDPEEYHQLCVIVKSHFPEMTQEQVDALLLKLRKEGCGYVAMINSLFDIFIDRPKEFEEAFGFSMYDSDGSLNYNHVLVDLYCKKDNHNGGRFLFFTWDIYAKNEDRVWRDEDKDGTYEWVEKPFGNNELQMKYRWETYCKEHGIRATVNCPPSIQLNNFDRYAKKGSVSILCSDFKMTNDKNQTTHVKNGHFMTITGVTEEDKKFVVSSWGEKYYLDPKDIKGFKYYQVISYKI